MHEIFKFSDISRSTWTNTGKRIRTSCVVSISIADLFSSNTLFGNNPVFMIFHAHLLSSLFAFWAQNYDMRFVSRIKTKRKTIFFLTINPSIKSMSTGSLLKSRASSYQSIKWSNLKPSVWAHKPKTIWIEFVFFLLSIFVWCMGNLIISLINGCSTLAVGWRKWNLWITCEWNAFQRIAARTTRFYHTRVG